MARTRMIGDWLRRSGMLPANDAREVHVSEPILVRIAHPTSCRRPSVGCAPRTIAIPVIARIISMDRCAWRTLLSTDSEAPRHRSATPSRASQFCRATHSCSHTLLETKTFATSRHALLTLLEISFFPFDICADCALDARRLMDFRSRLTFQIISANYAYIIPHCSVHLDVIFCASPQICTKTFLAFTEYGIELQDRRRYAINYS
jgi:hypothetical protein